MSKADSTQLDHLHSLIASTLTRIIEDEEFNPSENIGILNVARQFLKDNKIEADVVEGNPFATLANLPVFDKEQQESKMGKAIKKEAFRHKGSC